MSEERQPESITLSDRLRPRRSVTTEILDDEAVLHVEGRRSLHVLNPTASLIWQNLDGDLSLNELCALLSEAADVPIETVEQDVLRAVRSFGASGLLQGVAATDADEDLPSDTPAVPGDDLRFLPEPPHG